MTSPEQADVNAKDMIVPTMEPNCMRHVCIAVEALLARVVLKDALL